MGVRIPSLPNPNAKETTTKAGAPKATRASGRGAGGYWEAMGLRFCLHYRAYVSQHNTLVYTQPTATGVFLLVWEQQLHLHWEFCWHSYVSQGVGFFKSLTTVAMQI